MSAPRARAATTASAIVAAFSSGMPAPATAEAPHFRLRVARVWLVGLQDPGIAQAW